MHSIKFLKKQQIKLNGITYTPFTLNNLPQRFAFIYDENKEQDGITEWFNYKGFTYIAI